MLNLLEKTLLIAAVATLVSGSVMASPYEYERDEAYGRRGPLPFEIMDLNGDGVITADEHAQVRAERQAVRREQGYPMRNAGNAPRFEDIDGNADGTIGPDEFSAWQAQRMQPGGMGPGYGRNPPQ